MRIIPRFGQTVFNSVEHNETGTEKKFFSCIKSMTPPLGLNMQYYILNNCLKFLKVHALFKEQKRNAREKDKYIECVSFARAVSRFLTIKS